ncbi:M23 family metallopeptidase [Clostridiaceae bacterium 35-E11]
MDFYKKFKRFTDEYLSIMIVPHSGKSIRQLKLRKSFVYSFLAITATMVVGVFTALFFFMTTHIDLKHEIQMRSNDLSKLEEINMEQEREIYDLKNRTSAISQKLSALNALELQVRSLVGLKKDTNLSTSKPSSRSAIRSKLSLESNSINESSQTIDQTLEVLSSAMDQEVNNLNNLINDVTVQLKFLNAKPDRKPASGKIASKFGYRVSPINGKSQFHKGIDIANAHGTNIFAAGTGIVTFSGWNSGYGKTIIISHGYGYRSVYAHNSKNLVEVGDKVNKGDVIAKMGSTGKSTGPHVHFEIHYKGEQINPQNLLVQE